MLRTHMLLLLAASGLVACGDRPTSPLARRADGTPLQAGIQLQGYSVSILPLLPAGISDAGVIAGTYGDSYTTYAAIFRNGSITLLAQPANVKGNYYASAINRNGAIIGGMQDGPGLFWRSSDSLPMQIKSPVGLSVRPIAVNEGNVVVGMYTTNAGDRVFRWTPPHTTSRLTTFIDITPDGSSNVIVQDVNNSNLVVGWGTYGVPQALRWPAVAGAAVTPLAGDMATAIRDNGDALGVAGGFQYVTVWPLNGSSYQLPVAGQNYVDDVSSVGRVVGWTWSTLPKQPWTYSGGATTPLPLPNGIATTGFSGLRVNSCGSIVTTQLLGATRVGLLWTKLMCDEGTLVANPG